MTENDNVGVPPLSASFLLMTVGRRIREHVETVLGAHGIALRHFSALGHLARDPGVSYSELARRASVTPQSMQATLTKLEQLGAVEKTTDGGRGRTARLFVTPEGLRLLTEGRKAFSDADARLADQVDLPALQQLLPPLWRSFQ